MTAIAHADHPDLRFRWRCPSCGMPFWTHTPAALYAIRRQVRFCPFCGTAYPGRRSGRVAQAGGGSDASPVAG